MSHKSIANSQPKPSKPSTRGFEPTTPQTDEDEQLMEVCESFERFRHIQSGSLGTSVLKVVYKNMDIEKNPKIKWGEVGLYRVILFEKSFMMGEMEEYNNSKDLRGRFEIHFQPVNVNQKERLKASQIYLVDVVDLVIKKNLVIVLCLGPDRGTYYLRFENRHDYSTFSQLLNTIFQKPLEKEKGKGFSEGAGSVKMSQNLFKRAQEAKFWEKKTNVWNYKDVMNWTKHVLYQDLQGGTELLEIISINEKFIKLGQIRKFEEFAKTKIQDGWLIAQLETLFPVPPLDPMDPPKESDASDPKHLLYGIYINIRLRNRIAVALRDLAENDDLFSIDFYRVLRKRITFKSKPRSDPMNPKKKRIFYPNLELMIRILKYIKREWWSVEDCRNEILFLLLYNKSFSAFVKEKEEEFSDFISIQINDNEEEDEEIEEDGNNNNNKNNNKNDLLPAIRKFDDTHKLQLENLSFSVHVQHQASLILREIKKIELEKRMISKETKDMEENYKKKKKLYEGINKRILEGGPSKAKLYEKLKSSYEKQMKISEKRLEKAMSGKGMMKVIELDRKLSKFRGTLNEFRELENNDKIRDRMVDFFYKSKGRVTEIDRLIRIKLDVMQKNNEGSNTFVLTVKLVLGRLLMEPGKIHKLLARHLLKKLGGDYYTFGLTHSSLTIKNLQLHWFNTGLIHFKDLGKYDRYQEFFCCDVDCPLICDYEKFNERIEEFARNIITFNTMYKYSPFSVKIGNVIGDSLKKNCQEFTAHMLRSLGASDHYNEVQNYLDELKDKLEVNKKFINYQFFKVKNEFYRKYKNAYDKVFRDEEIAVKNNKFYTVVFKRHETVDDFVTMLLRINPNFKNEETGKWVLLKGFDRSYVMRELKDRGNPIFVSSERGCPFSVKVKVKLEDIFD